MIGLLGGTFDPIHFGHLRPAIEIKEKLQLQELRFIPSAKPPHRWQPEVDANHRLQMVKLATKGIKGFIVDDREYHRDGPSYSVDTLKSIREESDSKPICLILGLDAFQSFTTWKNWQDILNLCHIIVSARPGYEMQDAEHDWVDDRLVKEPKQLAKTHSGNVYFCDVTQLDISATHIRNQIKFGNSCHYLTPQVVCDYINKHKLYR